MSDGARILAIGGCAPVIDPDAVVLAGATVVGGVRVGARSSVWYAAVLRADQGAVGIGSDSNVQDGAVIHVDPRFPCTVGRNVTIGHQAMVHGCTIGDNSLIGIGAVILDGARIGSSR